MTPLTHVIETCLYANNIDAAERFYKGVLGLELFSKVDGKFVFFKLADSMLLIFDPTETEGINHDLPPHGAHGSGHVCFRIEAQDLGSWRSHLQKHGVAIEAEHVWSGGARSIYFRDPAGNSLELGPWSIWRQ